MSNSEFVSPDPNPPVHPEPAPPQTLDPSAPATDPNADTEVDTEDGSSADEG